MDQNQEGLVDLLEIYHARQMRNEIMTHLRRLRSVDPANPLSDYARHSESDFTNSNYSELPS